MLPVEAGSLRKRITVQSPAETSDGAGGSTSTWSDVFDSWASVVPLSGRELMQAEAVESDTSHRVTMRYRAGITSKSRILLGERVFRITAPPRDTEERHRELVIDCAEVTGEVS